ncbi:hypothetical protein PVAG01_05375 [Phlyctema vagabunda]|uniref:Uncharacterized protein n=1 Tax=Phlyctema vagabunda TaxID=108571 RepID=A0ABR4PJX8_9HELO
MSAQNTGRQSPEPERQSGQQGGDATSSGAVNDKSNSQKTSKSELENLESNPKPILEEHLKDTTSKTVNHPENASKA